MDDEQRARALTKILHNGLPLSSNDEMLLDDQEQESDRHRPLRSFGFPDSFNQAQLRLQEERLSAAEYREVVEVLTVQLDAAVMLRPDDEPHSVIRFLTKSLVWERGHQEDPADRIRLMELIVRASDIHLTRCKGVSADMADVIENSVISALASVAMMVDVDTSLETIVLDRWEKLMRSVARRDADKALTLAWSTITKIVEADKDHTHAPQIRKQVRRDCRLFAIATQWRDTLVVDSSGRLAADHTMAEKHAMSGKATAPHRVDNVIRFPKKRGPARVPT